VRHVCAIDALDLEGDASRRPGRLLVVAAHPDDETIGAGATMGELARVGFCLGVLHVTDGAPRDPRLRPWSRGRSPEEAARVRRAEAHAALDAQGVAGAVLLPSLGVPDLRAAFALAAIARAVAERIAAMDATVVVTHPYEGGHPDHDAVAFAVHAAVRIAGARGLTAALAEMTSYHWADGALVTARFRDGGPRPPCDRVWAARLDAAARARKRRMLDAFASQASVLAPFGVDDEPIRCAPEYDFSRPPHAGVVHYETLPFGVRAADVCALMRSAARELGAPGGR